MRANFNLILILPSTGSPDSATEEANLHNLQPPVRHISSSPPSVTPAHMTTQGHVTSQQQGHVTPQQQVHVTSDQQGHVTSQQQGHVTSQQQGHVTPQSSSHVTSIAEPIHSAAQQHGTSQHVQSGQLPPQQLMSQSDFKCEAQYMPQLKREVSDAEECQDSKRQCHEEYQGR